MAITNYTTLQTAIGDWLHRSDLTSYIPDFISIAEANLSADLHVRSMESRTTLTCTASNAYVSLPTDMMGMRRLVVTTSSPYQVLKYISPDELYADYSTTRTGTPVVFTVIGSQIQLAPIPDAAHTLELTYQQKIPALSVGSPTNWLITAWPNAYLFASLCAAQPFIANDPRLPVFQQQYQEAVQNINSIDWYSGSTMIVRAS